MNPLIADAIARIVDYNWQDEARDYAEQLAEHGPDDPAVTRHIYNDLQLVADWLGETETP